MRKFKLEFDNPPVMTDEEVARLDALTPEQIEQNAIDDPDNPPLTDEELDSVRSAKSIQAIRRSRGLTQAEFAKRYRIAIGRLRDWEQGRFKPDEMAQTYLEIIRGEPDAVDRVLGRVK